MNKKNTIALYCTYTRTNARIHTRTRTNTHTPHTHTQTHTLYTEKPNTEAAILLLVRGKSSFSRPLESTGAKGQSSQYPQNREGEGGVFNSP